MPGFSQFTEFRPMDNARGSREGQVADANGQFRARMGYDSYCPYTDALCGYETYKTQVAGSLREALKVARNEIESAPCAVWLDFFVGSDGRKWREVELNSVYGHRWRGHDMCDDSAEKVPF